MRGTETRLFGVRVLGSLGVGSLSDTLEGIQWVIFNAKTYNIRVMNLSLAADSSESWRTGWSNGARPSAARQRWTGPGRRCHLRQPPPRLLHFKKWKRES